MAKTIKDMFLTEVLPGSTETASTKYAVRNSKDTELHAGTSTLVTPATPNGVSLLEPSFKLYNGVRKTLSNKTTETAFEEEITGISVLHKLSLPIIYGIDTVKQMKGQLVGSSDMGITTDIVNMRKSVSLNIETPAYLANTIKSKISVLGIDDLNIENNTNTKTKPIKLFKPIVDTFNNLIDSAKYVYHKTLNQDTGMIPTYVADVLSKNTDYPKIYTKKDISKNGVESYINTKLSTPKQLSSTYKDYISPENYVSTSVPDGIVMVAQTDDKRRGDINAVPALTLDVKVAKEKNRKFEYSKKTTKSTAKKTITSWKVDAISNNKMEDVTDEFNLNLPGNVPLKFTSVVDKKTVSFISTISGLNESISPEFDSFKFVGNPFYSYTYSGVQRSVSFNFKVYSMNSEQHKNNWDRIQYLTHLAYPQGYSGRGLYINPPFILATIGDLYINKECIIESISYTFSDEGGWNVGESTDNTYKLPFIIEVSLSLKFVESRNNTSGKYYGFGNPVGNIQQSTTPESNESIVDAGTAEVKNSPVSTNVIPNLSPTWQSAVGIGNNGIPYRSVNNNIVPKESQKPNITQIQNQLSSDIKPPQLKQYNPDIKGFETPSSDYIFGNRDEIRITEPARTPSTELTDTQMKDKVGTTIRNANIEQY